MLKQSCKRMLLIFLVAAIFALSLSGCSTGGETITVSYTTPILPITFSIDSNGKISLRATANFATEVGDFAVTVSSNIASAPASANELILTIRHKKNGKLYDDVYRINTGKAGSADVQGDNMSEVRTTWNGQNYSIFIDASNGDITKIVIQGTSPSSTPVATMTNVPISTPVEPTPTPSFTPTSIPTATPTTEPESSCPDASQVSSWMGISVSQVSLDDDLCAFYVFSQHPLHNVICTNLDGGTSIEYNTVDAPTTVIIKNCDGKQLPDIYQFIIRFVNAYPEEEASV